MTSAADCSSFHPILIFDGTKYNHQLEAISMTGHKDQTVAISNGGSGGGDANMADKGKADVPSPVSAAAASLGHVWFCIV
jgi:hypothetical protein